MDVLQEQDAALRTALRRVRAELQVERKRRSEDSGVMHTKVPLRCAVTLATAEAVFHLADRGSAEEFFLWARRNKQSGGVTALPAEMVLRWACKSADEVAEVLGGAGEPSIARRRALKFLRERSLRDWVREQNVGKACAPGGHAVQGEARRLGALQEAAAPMAAPAAPQAAAHRTGQKQWLRRWARRWNLRRGRFQTSSRLLPEDAARKAHGTHRGAQWVEESAIFWAPVLGPKRGPKTGTALCGGIRDGGRFSVRK